MNEQLAAILAKRRTLFACRWLRIHHDGFAWLIDTPAATPTYQLQLWLNHKTPLISLWQRGRSTRFQVSFHPWPRWER